MLLFILFSHGNILCGSIEKSKLNKLHTITKEGSTHNFLCTKGLPFPPLHVIQASCLRYTEKKDCIQSHFKRVAHKYPTRHSQFAFYSQQYETCKYNKCKISKGGPLLWNSFKNLSLDLIN